MPPVRNLRPGYAIDFPNRDKPASKATKAIVILLLLVSVVLMLIVTLGGWSKLQGLKAVNLAWAAVYVIMAIYIARWNRGLLPIAAALAILLLILTLIAGTGISGTSWFDRSHAGFAPADSIFGGKGLSPDTLGLVTILIAPFRRCSSSSPCAASPRAGTSRSRCPRTRSSARTSRPAAPPPNRPPRSPGIGFSAVGRPAVRVS